MTITDLCTIVSEQSPDKWPVEVLQPLHKQPVSIFGYAQVAMSKDLSRSLVEALVWTGLCESNNQARTAIRANSVMINRIKIHDVSRILTAADALPNLGAIVLESGKRNFGIIELC